jgi:hypothetical protein
MKNDHVNLASLVVDELPDGSKVVVDPVNGTVLALRSATGKSPVAAGGSNTRPRNFEDAPAPTLDVRSIDPSALP